jgi:hypothetical protein
MLLTTGVTTGDTKSVMRFFPIYPEFRFFEKNILNFFLDKEIDLPLKGYLGK